MGLAKSGVSIDKKWVVNFARSLAYCMSSGSGELVRLADYEEIKSVTLAKWGRTAATLRGGQICDNRWWSDEKIHLRTLLPLFVYAEHHVHGVPEDYWAEARQ
jgi:hypothetical protein